jgi:diadenylate cyclase
VLFSLMHKNWILDVLDILLVAVLFYRLLILVRGTRAAQMFVGLVVLVTASLLARWFHLATVDYLATSLRTVWLITFVILFQPELRHMLSEFGRTRYFRSLFRVNEYGTIGEVVRAAEELASRRQGGLLVLERNQGLRNFVETGTRLDARVTAELMVSLFSPGSPLHDGALILRGDQVVAAGCILPLSPNPRLSSVLGTRHRAAVGITEESDAVAVVVSEHTQAISVAFRGELRQRLNEGELRSELARVMRIRDEDESKPEPPAPAPLAAAGSGDPA